MRKSGRLTHQRVLKMLGLTSDANSQNVKTLHLPGSSSKAKITELGDGLVAFPNVQNLDLSRNKIQSVDGLLHLTGLKTLILYFNSITSIEEVLKLGCMASLKELDLRLNGVTTVKDYRLLVIRFIPSLIMLDGAKVFPDERIAAQNMRYVLPSERRPKRVHKKKKEQDEPSSLMSIQSVCVPFVSIKDEEESDLLRLKPSKKDKEFSGESERVVDNLLELILNLGVEATEDKLRNTLRYIIDPLTKHSSESFAEKEKENDELQKQLNDYQKVIHDYESHTQTLDMLSKSHEQILKTNEHLLAQIEKKDQHIVQLNREYSERLQRIHQKIDSM
ncbi:hypothetical protein PCE1_001301 [Barthelona sp. PCE]